MIPDIREFHEAVKIGLTHVENGKLVTFGIKPTHPETGYGYLELLPGDLDPDGVSEVVSFIEKPNFKIAERMLTAGNFLWNAGIFLFTAQDMIEAFKTYAPAIMDNASIAVRDATPDLGFLRLSSEPWAALDNISIDFAIMEKTNLVAVPYTSKWSDLGGWDAMGREQSRPKW